MMRVVFDTNVVVSAALTRGGAEAYALDLAATRRVEAFVSVEILAEYEAVLRRPKFKLTPKAVAGVIGLIRAFAVVVKPANRVGVSPDEGDNRFLECAETCAAHFLITGNRRHFPMTWRETRIINARELVEFAD
jgi:putative PIN family toxin of toxin-antitoxin system